MSHQPERKEKDCLNCGTIVEGRYCQDCGQENVVTKQSAGALVKHFIFDIFHFDGKFFDTIKHLLFRPGFVPKQYASGKRASYLDPIRMYLFTSALFFLVFFTFREVRDWGGDRIMKASERLNYVSYLRHKGIDSNNQQQINYLLDTSYTLKLTDPGPNPVETGTSFLIKMEGKTYQVSASKRLKLGDSFITFRPLSRRLTVAESDFAEDGGESLKKYLNSFLHRIPYILFLSLPFFALILKLLYVRKKEVFYSDQAVFTLYHYIFIFLLFLVSILIEELNENLNWDVLTYLRVLLIASGGFYLYWAMLKFYGQGWLKTLGKFIVLNILGFIMLFILFLIFILFSLVQIQ